LGSANHIWIVILGLVGLRFAGQGLMSHISSTTISKIFTTTRGRALSVISIGYALSEGIFPGVIGSILSHFGWRIGFFLSAAIIGLVLLPLVVFLLNDEAKNKVHVLPKSASQFSRTFLFKDIKFYIIASNAAVMPFLLTGFFFYQLQLGEEKSWSMEWIGFSFIGFAGSRMLFSIISGPWIDRWTAKNLFPFYLFPFLLGLAILINFNHPYIAFVYMMTAGISVGINTNIVTAVLAEVYGSEFLGGIRSIFSMLSVVSTAMSPLLFGYLLDHGFQFTDIVFGAIGFIIFIIFLSFAWVRLDKK
ncbi:MAG: MFS transporter, partial [Leptospira sp.]|nr:MFS transporter [Leptospira sp.]